MFPRPSRVPGVPTLFSACGAAPGSDSKKELNFFFFYKGGFSFTSPEKIYPQGYNYNRSEHPATIIENLQIYPVYLIETEVSIWTKLAPIGLSPLPAEKNSGIIQQDEDPVNGAR